MAGFCVFFFLVFFLFVYFEMGSYCVAWTCLEFLGSSDLLVSSSQVAGTTGIYHHARLRSLLFLMFSMELGTLKKLDILFHCKNIFVP